MTSIDPSFRFREAVRSFATHDSVDETPSKSRELSDIAREVASHFSDRPISPNLLYGWVRLGDLGIVLLSGLVIASFQNWSLVDRYTLALTTLGGVMALLVNQAIDSYQVASLKSVFAATARVFGAWTVSALAAAAILIATVGIDALRLAWVFSWYIGALGLLVTLRAMLAGFVKNWIADGRLERRAVIVGGGNAAAELIQSIEAQKTSDIRICGIFDDRADDRSPPIVRGYPKLGNIADLVEFGRITQLDMLIVTIPLRAETRVLDLLRKLWVLPVDIHLSAHADKLKFRPRSYTYVASVPMLAVFDKPLADWDAVAKRVFDLVFGTIALILTAPIMVAAAIAIKLDSKGPVLFRQKRYGFNNEVVEVLKFRSMYVEQADPDAKKVVTKGDPRVTRVGRFIRKTSIDELPQLFNVLMGSLALVGPRPHALKGLTQNRLFEQVVDGYFARHKVKPGVTGWAQINGWRGEVDTPDKIRKRVEYDLYYIENWSLLLDFKILILTPFRILGQEGAY